MEVCCHRICRVFLCKQQQRPFAFVAHQSSSAFSTSVRRNVVEKSSLHLKQRNGILKQLWAAESSLKATEERSHVGLFKKSILRDASGFMELFHQTSQECEHIVAKILECDHAANGNANEVVRLFDDLSNAICCAADLTDAMRLFHEDRRWQASAEEAMHHYTELVESLNTKRALYDRLKEARLSRMLGEVETNVADLLLHDFEASGVHLAKSERQKFVELSSHIFRLSAEYTRTCDEPCLIEQGDLSRTLYERMLPYTSGVRDGKLELHNSLGWADHADVRRFGYSQYFRFNKTQSETLHELLATRHSLAQLVGFSSYAERAQAHTLLQTPERVFKFLEGLLSALKPLVRNELTHLSRMLPSNETLSISDIQYLTTRYKQISFKQQQAMYEPYLHRNKIARGFGRILEYLYGCGLTELKAEPGEVWSSTVRKFGVFDENNNLLGHVYGDFEHRPNKFGGDCHATIRCSKLLRDGTWQTPIVALSLSLQPGVHSLSTGQTENAWHEFGHAMHSMFGRTRYQHVAGTRCSTDLAEVPSNLMECFYYDARVLQRCFTHAHKDDQAMPRELAQNLANSQLVFQATEMQQQCAHSLFDLYAHQQHNNNSSATELHQLYMDIMRRSLDGRCEIPDGTFWPHRFGHLVPYGAKYYSYLVARACAALIYQSLFRSDPFSRSNGENWRAIQAKGGEIPTQILMRECLGYTPTEQHLIDALYCEAERGTRMLVDA